MLDFRFFPQIVLAGKARLTIKNPISGQHIKIRMLRKKDRATGEFGSCYFLHVALLGDGDLGYNYAGAYFSDSGRFKTGRDVVNGSMLDTISRFVVASISHPEKLQKAEIEHAGKCCRCGRTLTHPESIRSGLGPECFGLVYGATDQLTRDLANAGLAGLI